MERQNPPFLRPSHVLEDHFIRYFLAMTHVSQTHLVQILKHLLSRDLTGLLFGRPIRYNAFIERPRLGFRHLHQRVQQRGEPISSHSRQLQHLQWLHLR